MEAARHLQAIQGELIHETGEVIEHDPKDDLIETLELKLRASYGEVTKLKRQVANIQGLEPESDDIREVLGYWREALMPAAMIKPGSERWQKVKDRLGEGFSVAQLRLVVDGVRLSEFHMRKRAYHDAKSIYGTLERVEAHVATALNQQAQLVPILKLPVALEQANLDYLAERCDCGHLRIEHTVNRADGPMQGWSPCMARGCECGDFDDFFVRERWRPVAA